MTRAEAVALSLVAALAVAILLSYFADLAGFGVAPRVSGIIAIGTAILIAVLVRPSRSAPGDVALFLSTMVVAAGVLVRVAWPSMLPPGSGPDLTHHLMLIDFIERQGTLVHDPDGGRLLGEMADYTPGVHILSVVAAALADVPALFTVYPVIAFTVALELGLSVLIFLRLVDSSRARLLVATTGILMVVAVTPVVWRSFAHDSFLAQVVSELFALVMWWALIVWHQQPSRWSLAIFGGAGAAAFLTWPIWVGPPIAALVLLLAWRREAGVTERVGHLILAVVPIACVAAVHTLGRTSGVSLAGGSGAIEQPAMSALDWWLPILATVGLLFSVRKRTARPLIALTAGIVLQASALWLLARFSGASTPYMAIKMLYLGVYPAAAAAMLAIAAFAHTPRALALPVLVLGIVATRSVVVMETPTPIVSRELWSVGSRARETVPPSCVDYLVGNEYTAYWLHLAVLGNARADPRSADNDTYLTQPSFARWVAATGDAPYAIARWSILPAEIRDRTRVLHREGDAALITRVINPPACTR